MPLKAGEMFNVPAVADSVPVLVSVLAAMLIRPPATSAEIVPPLLIVLGPPTLTWPPMVPFCPWIVTPDATFRMPVLSTAMRFALPVLPRVIEPVPPKVCVPPSNTRMLLLLMATLPFAPSVRPPPTCSKPALVARSTRPFTVTAFNTLAPLLVATKAPPALPLRVPPLMVTPFWSTVLPAPVASM